MIGGNGWNARSPGFYRGSAERFLTCRGNHQTGCQRQSGRHIVAMANQSDVTGQSARFNELLQMCFKSAVTLAAACQNQQRILLPVALQQPAHCLDQNLMAFPTRQSGDIEYQRPVGVACLKRPLLPDSVTPLQRNGIRRKGVHINAAIDCFDAGLCLWSALRNQRSGHARIGNNRVAARHHRIIEGFQRVGLAVNSVISGDERAAGPARSPQRRPCRSP